MIGMAVLLGEFSLSDINHKTVVVGKGECAGGDRTKN